MTAAVRVERVLTRAVAFLRIAGMAEIALVVGLAGARFPHPVGTAALLVAVAVESAAMLVTWSRAGWIRTPWVSFDVAFCTAGIAAGAGLTVPSDGHTWIHFMYPFTIIISVGIGLGYRRLSAVLVATACLSTSYAISAVLLHHDPVWNTIPNAVSYLPNTLVSWMIARHLRISARETDDQRAAAIAQAAELAEAGERAWFARMLHDRVLQTMETLARGATWLPDAGMRGHVAAEAAWLRALVQGDPDRSPGDLLYELHQLVRSRARTGLSVDLNTAGLDHTMLSPGAVQALVGSVHEALTNVAKHSGATSATIRAATADGRLVVSVLDHGTGFDLTTAPIGFGLTHSIRERLTAIGGSVRIESSPGTGTYVELSLRDPSSLRSPHAWDSGVPRSSK
ncbi:MAG TPA: ATP-binding protein [Streptosporangiaceae bacterium]|nr:ATP-binding protein [Streptosporangiaceae bacterium]